MGKREPELISGERRRPVWSIVLRHSITIDDGTGKPIDAATTVSKHAECCLSAAECAAKFSEACEVVAGALLVNVARERRRARSDRLIAFIAL